MSETIQGVLGGKHQDSSPSLANAVRTRLPLIIGRQ